MVILVAVIEVLGLGYLDVDLYMKENMDDFKNKWL